MLDGIYRLLLAALPRGYDSDDREEMLETFRQRVAHAGERAGQLAALREGGAEALDMLGTVVVARWPLPSFDSLHQDMRVAARSLRRTPVATTLAVLSLALGIGATSSMFSALDVWLLRPLPLPNEARLIDVGMANRARGWTRNAFSIPDYVDWAAASEKVELMVHASTSYNLAVGGSAEHVSALQVSANALSVLGIEPALGRSFTAEEGTRAGPRVVLLTDAFWKASFGAVREVIGETMLLDGISHTVVGVLPPRQGIPTQRVDIWVPLRISGEESRGGHFLSGVGLLGEGVSVEAARAELESVAASVVERDPEGLFPDAFVRTYRERIYGREYQQGGVVLAIAALFVLLIACANIANILLARGVARTQELAVRGALGAGRRRIVQQLLVESTLIAFFGGIVGVAVAAGGIELLLTYALPAEYVTGWDDIALNGRVLMGAGVLTVVSVLVFGLVPAFRASSFDLRERLAASGVGRALGGRSRIASALVVGEISATLFLVALSALLIRSLAEVQRVDLGMRTADALVYRLDVPAGSRAGEVGIAAFYEEVARRLSGISEVSGVTTTSGHVLSQWSTSLYSIPSAQGADQQARLSAERRAVAPSYLDVMDLELVAGRWFDAAVDLVDGPPVAVVSRQLAAQWWEDPADALGQTIRYADPERTIVGVVDPGRMRGPSNPTPAAIFVPFAQSPTRATFNVMTHDMTTEAAANAVRTVVQEIDPNLALFDMQSIEAALQESLGPQTAGFRILGAFGALGLLLTVVGVYGVMAHSVGRRLPEMGLRVALGADGRGLIRMILAANTKLAAVGLGIGLVLATAGGEGIEFILTGVSPRDPAVLGGVSALVFAVVLLASYLPARRVALVDPVKTLRRE